MTHPLRFGFPLMHKESGEQRDFLPSFVGRLHRLGADVFLEQGYGSGMSFTDLDYSRVAPMARFVSHAEAYQQDIVIVLRCPNDDELSLLQPGSCLISMLHYPTRPQRVALLRTLGVEAISLDSLKDDSGRRLVENLRAVAWNGVEVAMQTMHNLYPSPGFDNPGRPPLRVTLLGAGAVGSHVVQAAIRYGDSALWERMIAANVPGVQVTAVDYDLSGRFDIMRPIFAETDILVDATQRPDPGYPVVPNEWIAYLPEHAIILDLSVDPYIFDTDTFSVKGIEGIPQGDLDQYVFAFDDPAYDVLPECINTQHRRCVVSCYSWPGIHPKECMEVYGRQLRPIMRNILEKGSLKDINPQGRFFERVIGRALLSCWDVREQ